MISSESPEGQCVMGTCRYQQQGPSIILYPFQFTSVFEENFSPGKPGGFKTIRGILNTECTSMGMGEGQRCLESNGNDAPRTVQVTETN